MPRQLISDSHHGLTWQVIDAIHALGPRQTKKLRAAFPEVDFDRMDLRDWLAYGPDDHGNTDTEGEGWWDVELESWLCDWIENNTRFYWEDGDLWHP